MKIYFTRDLTISLYGAPAVPKGMWDNTVPAYNENLMKALSDYAKKLSNSDYGLMWNGHFQTHRELIDLLINGELHKAHEYLGNMHSKPVLHGISQSDQIKNIILQYPQIAQDMVNSDWDVLLGLCEYLGIVAPQNQEQHAVFLKVPIDELIIGLKKVFPGFVNLKWQGGLWGLETTEGIVCNRSTWGLYYALQMKLKNPDINTKFLMIGDGVGYASYWLYRLGYKNLTLIDLPTIAMCQAYQLSVNIGSENVSPPGTNIAGATVKWILPEEIEQSTEQFDVVFNADSMPEMSKEFLHLYLRIISERAKSFYSVNQEGKNQGQLSVHHEINRNFKNKLYRKSRNLFWLRTGYTEEWYHTNNF